MKIKNKNAKKAVLNTTTLIFDFENSDFHKLTERIQIWEYDIPEYMRPKRDEDYAKIYIWARNQTDNPHFLHSYTLKLYIGYIPEEVVLDVYDYEGTSPLSKKNSPTFIIQKKGIALLKF